MEVGTQPGDRPRNLRCASGFLAGTALFWLLLGAVAAAEGEHDLPQTTFGNVGLIEMPSARMAPSGTLFAGASFFQNTQHYNLGFQIFPWLEGSFRYSGLQHFDPLFPVYYDRSFALKARLWDEGDVIPAVAVGINDLVGTGVYSSEYVVASKRFGDIDTMIGMGWGRLSSTGAIRNPLALMSNSFETRPTLTTPGGTNFNVYFHGPSVGLFGGAVWNTPIDGLSLIAEYSSDKYTLEADRGNFTPRNQMNYGLSYRLSEGMTLGLSWLYGRRLAGSLSFNMDPTKPQYPSTVGPSPPPIHVRTADEQRKALEHYVGLHNGDQKRLVAHVQHRDKFVDTLWAQQDVTDIEVKGSTLILTVAEENLSSRCSGIERSARSYLGEATAIVVRHKDGTQQRCYPSSTAAAVQSEQRGAGTPSRLKQAALLTIDASAVSRYDKTAAIRKIREAAQKQRIRIEAIDLQDSEALVYYTNTAYFAETDAIDRLTRLLMMEAPPNVERFRFIATANGVTQREFSILRSPAERNYEQGEENDILDDPFEAGPAPMDNPVLAMEAERTYPRFSWGVFPQFHQALFDPAQPLGIQFLLGAYASVDILPGLSVNTGAEASLYDNFNTARQSDSALPHVRSDFVNYFTQGKNGLTHLDVEYRFKLTPNVFAVAKAGYLESMFAGVGGEVLWRPEGQRWALGVDAYEVQQRKFDRLFGLQDYRAFTGHVSLYYQAPWYDLNVAIRAGRYLAKDNGITFEVTRRFSTGVEIGAFMTKTNVSADQFGEGSFDKGIIIRIPLGWVAPIDTQSTFAMDLRPVQRDGGQRLQGDATLYYETQRSSQGEMLLTGNRTVMGGGP